MLLVDPLGHDVRVHEPVVVQIIQEAVGGAVVVREHRVGGISRGVGAESFPLSDVVRGYGGEVLRVAGLAYQGGDARHGGYADDAFEGEVGLVFEVAGEVVGGELEGGVEAVLDEVFDPLFEDGVVGF